MSGPGKVHCLRPGFTVNGQTIPARTSCGRDPEQVRVGRHPMCGRCLQIAGPAGYRRAGNLNSKRWRPATGRNPPIEGGRASLPFGATLRGSPAGAGGGAELEWTPCTILSIRTPAVP